MIKFLLIIGLAFSVQAKSPVEGGKEAPIESFDYVDVVKLKNPQNDTCSGTRISSILIITAAHCIVRYEKKATEYLIKKGMVLPGLGKVVNYHIHPKYLAEKIAYEDSKNKDAPFPLRTLYDVAFIELELRPSQRTLPYPKIISAETKFASRKKMEMAGYGSNETKWNGKQFDFNNTRQGLQIGYNEWAQCPLNYFGDEVHALEKFKNTLLENLEVSAQRVHTISGGVETIDTNNTAMILPGDSGSPALERDVNNNLVITGIGSNLNPFVSGDASLEIEVDGKKLFSEKLKEIPNDWGLVSKSDRDFPVIQQKLEAYGLVNELGYARSGVVVKRKYTRISKGRYADLSHPDNQAFIKFVMKKY